MLDVLEMFTVIIIDSGVLMEHRVFESPIIAELFVLEYMNNPEEVIKRAYASPKFLNFGAVVRWAEGQPNFNVHIIASRLRIRP